MPGSGKTTCATLISNKLTSWNISGVRGNEWGPVSLHTDDDFREAGILWGGSQSFVRSLVDSWEIPNIIIENKDYNWDEYSDRIIQFISENIPN